MEVSSGDQKKKRGRVKENPVSSATQEPPVAAIT